MVKNGFKSVFCIFRLVMDPFDERILNVLKKAGSASFNQLLAGTGISHSTVRLHLHRLVDQHIV